MRLVRWVKYGPGDGTLYDFDPVELGYVAADPAGIATLNPGSWPQGRLLVGYEHGMDAPPSEVKRQAALATRRQMNQHKSQVDARATTYQSVEGGTVGLATPGLGPWVTGVPSIDETVQVVPPAVPVAGCRLMAYTSRVFASFRWVLDELRAQTGRRTLHTTEKPTVDVGRRGFRAVRGGRRNASASSSGSTTTPRSSGSGIGGNQHRATRRSTVEVVVRSYVPGRTRGDVFDRLEELADVVQGCVLDHRD